MNYGFISQRSSHPEKQSIAGVVLGIEVRVTFFVFITEAKIEPAIRGKTDCSDKSVTVIVPVIEIGLDRNYDELIGAKLLNPGWESWCVTQARQEIRFRLDERGARLESTAEMAVGADAGKPRQMIFDRPFLLMLREKDDGQAKEPYLAVWIENTEVLKPFAEEETTIVATEEEGR